MCVIFAYLRCYAAMPVRKKTHDIDDLGKRLMQTWLDFKQDVIDAAIDQCADGGHFEHVL